MKTNKEDRGIGWNLEQTYLNLPEVFYTRNDPEETEKPEWVILNHELAECLGLHPENLQNDEGLWLLSGNKMSDMAVPFSQAYAGHQFGHFTILGDGRAHMVGEQITPEGARYDIQLKGSGRTPYSRQGDGRAALGPMLREYIMGEAMHALGIPTSRVLSVATTGQPVYRERVLDGAVLSRVAQSHIRIGTFEYAAYIGKKAKIKALADYTMRRHFPAFVEEGAAQYQKLLGEAIRKQAFLVAQWQLKGFIHGVMNTDNIAISGETIDYGPCAFMDTYHEKTVFSSIDELGRYAYGNQPAIAEWNLVRFAETLLPLLDEDQEAAIAIAKETLMEFMPQFTYFWMNGMRKKLGIFDQEEADEALFNDLLSLMQKEELDYTNAFLALTYGGRTLAGSDSMEKAREALVPWVAQWEERKKRESRTDRESLDLMKQANPAVIPRNHQVEKALEAAVRRSDLSVMEDLLEVLKRPFDHEADYKKYQEPAGPKFSSYRTFCGT